MRGNYISALDTLPDTIMIRILTCYLCTSPKLLQCEAMLIANRHSFYPPERGETGQSLPRLARFLSGALKTGGSLSDDVLLHRCIQTAVPNHLSHAMNPSFFSSFAIQKAVLRHNERLANERILTVLVIVSNAIQVREI